MDMAQVPVLPNAATTSTCERISNQPPPLVPLPCSVTLNSGDDDSGVRLDPNGHTKVESEVEAEEPKPNFRFENHASRGDVNDEEPCGVTVNSGTLGDAGNAGISDSMFSTPPQSEDYPLSLISWYSEPGDAGPVLRSCCAARTSCLQNEVIAQSPLPLPCQFSYGEESDEKSDEKENKTPPPPSAIKSGSSISNSRTEKCLAIKMKLEGADKCRIGRRLDRKCDGSGIERSRSVGNPTRSANTRIRKASTDDHEPSSLECPRCSRKTKSGHSTPLVTAARIPKRTIAVKSTGSTKSADSRKPIKSILKSDLRGCSSGSEKQSSMDSLGSNHTSGGSNAGQMTCSDVGPRLKTKFSKEFNGKQWTESDFVGLKRIERYATVRINRPKDSKTSIPTLQGQSSAQECGGKLSFENLERQRSGSSDLMTKSMPHVKTHDMDTAHTSQLQRNGSLRGRRATPTTTPCATRTSVLRLQKMQEKKGLVPPSTAAASDKTTTNGQHSDSGESTATPAQLHSSSKAAMSKVFSKLSSAVGQTASSAQKRQRQERGIQTEPILILEKPAPTNGHAQPGIRASGISRSPTPMSPDEGASQTENKLDPGIEILRLRQELKKYKARVIKYEHIYNAAEQENVLLGNHLRDVENESKETISFLQDEKLMLAESLAESEAEKKALLLKLETQMKIVQKLEDKLNLGRSKVREAHQDVASYTTDLESESLKTKTLQDEVATLRKRVEKLNEEQQ